MQQTSISKKKGFLIIFIFWLIYFFIDLTSNGLYNLENNKAFFTPASLFSYTMYVVQILTILFNYFFIAPKFLKFISWKNIFISIFLSFSFFILMRFGIEQMLTNYLFDTINYHPNTSFLYYIFDNFHFASFVVFCSFFLWIVIDLIQSNEINQQIEREKSQAEIKFLKAQINPHFLFNTLNNIYSLVQFKPDSALKGIENLSSIMRFTTYETNKDQIEIEKEINYIQEYLALEKLRFGEQFFVDFDLNIVNNHQFIYPYLISPLIENALKHGVVKDFNHPIKIIIHLDSGFCNVEVKNRINANQKDSTNGIGLDNLRKRLDFYFGKNYVLDLNSDENIFNVELKFPVDEQN